VCLIVNKKPILFVAQNYPSGPDTIFEIEIPVLEHASTGLEAKKWLWAWTVFAL
jgi:hypothetical protein